LAVTDDNRLAISDFDRVQVFDAQTGAKLSELDVGRVVGLARTTPHADPDRVNDHGYPSDARADGPAGAAFHVAAIMRRARARRF
jgi:hypothetical protein